MTRDQMLAYLRAADEVAREAAGHGHHPFGCVLVGSDDRILMRQGNIDTLRHAETELCRRAAAAYPPDFLWTCTLVSTGEPCAMCTGALYWANIGRLLYDFEEAKLLAETGDHPENPTMSLAARTNSSPRTGPSGDADEPPFRRSCQGLTLASRGQAHMIGMPQRSAGILLYRLTDAAPEALPVHPGGPFWAKNDDGTGRSRSKPNRVIAPRPLAGLLPYEEDVMHGPNA